MAEAYVPQDPLSLAKFVLYHVLIFIKAVKREEQCTYIVFNIMTLFCKTLPVKRQKSHLRESTFQNFPGELAPAPLECLAPSVLATHPPPSPKQSLTPDLSNALQKFL